MIRVFTIISVCLLTLFTAFGDELGITMNYFKAGFEGTDVKVEWEVANENGIQNYELSRKLPSESGFKKVSEFPAAGTRRYVVIDTDLRNAPNRIGTIAYKLTVKTTAGDAVFNTNFVNNPSSVERSWGSIKSMFR